VAVPLFDTTSALFPVRAEVERAIARVLDRGRYVLGEELSAVEAELAAYLGRGHVIGVGNGTDAITLSLLALGIGPGDTVVVPSYTFYASAEAVVPTGAKPVFCEVDPDTCCVNAETVKAALTPATKAVIAVDLFGNPAPVEAIEELGIPVVEDAAQAMGSTLRGRPAGSLGRLATLSFYPSKNLPCLGDGGAVTTDDPVLADRLRILRSHGSRDRETYEIVAYNSRLDELQAAVLRVLLPRLDTWAAARRRVATLYRELGLGDHARLVAAVDGADPAWHLYVIRHDRRDAIADALAAAGIGHKAYYRVPIHRQPAMRRYARDELPITDEIARTNLAVPMGPTLTVGQIETVVSVIAGVVGG
jgi:dTDP-4-amino-4,6-dideoxygalactose transaminase